MFWLNAFFEQYVLFGGGRVLVVLVLLVTGDLSTLL
jgi:hypothetical protein